MEQEPILKPKSDMSRTLWAYLAVAVILSAIITGGLVYVVQKRHSSDTKKILQAQIDSLKSKVSQSITTPMPISTSVAAPTPTAMPALTTAQLLSFTYLGNNGKSLTLKSGTTNFPITGGTGSLTLDQKFIVNNDLNGDGAVDSIVVLWENDGGTGYSPSIAAVLNENGQPILSSQQSILDDRATIDSVTVKNDTVTVKGKVHGANQALADDPKVATTETYRLVNGKFAKQ